MKKMLNSLFSAFLFASLAASPAFAADDLMPIPKGARVIQLAHNDVTTPDHAHQVLAVKFANYLLENSGGKFGIEIIGNGVLGGERDMMEGLGLGTMDLIIGANQYTSSFIDDFKVFDIPYIYGVANYKGAIAVLADDAILAPLKKKLRDQFGAVLLSSGSLGFRHIINYSKDIRTVADIAGMKMRVPEVPSLVQTFRAWGANPTATPWAESFTAVQQKTVDGLEIPVASIYSYHYDDICKHMTLTFHGFQVLHLLASSGLWNSLTSEEQSWFQDAANRAANEQIMGMEVLDNRMLDSMSKKGVNIIPMENPEEWVEATKPVYDSFAKIIGWDIINVVKDRAAAAK
jgi:tripartite ATP-independent transporter DctP family solute receptor